MQLVHFTSKDKPLTEIRFREPDSEHNNNLDIPFKPTGLWVSDEDQFGWWSWCIRERYNLLGLELSYNITLADNHNVLILQDKKAVKQWSDQHILGERASINWYIDWNLVRRKWDGIIITPYLEEIRIDLDVFWYTTWDCASGCIWNPRAIKSFKFDTCPISF